VNVAVSAEIFTFGAVVDSKDGAKDFYLKYEFVAYQQGRDEVKSEERS
jgi:hypothetical protein